MGMDFHVALAGRGDLGGQIYRQIRAAVLDGRLRPGEQLPPSRELARRLSVSRNTVTAAYDRLVAEGFAESRVGAGTYVRVGGPVTGGVRAVPDIEKGSRPLPVWSQVRAPSPGFLAEQPEYDLRTGIPDVRLFPYETWRRLMSRALRASAVGTGMHGDPAGEPRLRDAIARHVGVSRGVIAGVDDVIVTQGVQQALDLVGRVLLRPGDVVAVEDPGYALPRTLFQTQGMRVVGVPVDDEGLRVDALPDDARLVYVTPSHQFPLGMAMSLDRRLALIGWARDRGAVIVEDDYDTEFRYGGRPIEPLQSLDDSGHVVYMGTFSKVMLPVLRLGFMVPPPSLREALRTAKFVADWQSPQPEQAALAGFVEEGLLARHIRRMRREYQARHDRIAAALARDFAGLLVPVPSAAGLHLAAWATDLVDARAVARQVRTLGVSITPLHRFRMPSPPFHLPPSPSLPNGLVFGYGAIPLAKVDRALEIIHGALDREAGRHGRG
jgi:GntR family transcriptional regulator/MocR family aminotransferase